MPARLTPAGDPVVTVHRRRMPGTYGLLTVRETVDAARAEITYTVKAPHVGGTFVAVPAFLWTASERAVIPDGVELRFGTGPHYEASWRRENRPHVYGIELVGCCRVDPFDFLARDEQRYGVHRSTGPTTSRPVPERTNRLALAVITQLLLLYAARPDRADLARTHARRGAAARLAQLHHGPIRAAREQIDKSTAELADHLAYAAALETLVAEHESLTSNAKETQP
ncbi:hypothetical protein AB0M47_20920 [Hamadaea sp. NPDC051192]|uniref:hypothetical protein n=1 Tax=Hamadaea sp. NPDC051192 TaxID=3154940 RepID=UPI003443A35E